MDTPAPDPKPPGSWGLGVALAFVAIAIFDGHHAYVSPLDPRDLTAEDTWAWDLLGIISTN